MPITAAEIMTSPAITVSRHATLAEIATTLTARHISALPVCNDDGTLAGIVSEIDVLRPIRQSARSRREWWLTHLAEGETLPQEFLDYLRQDTRTAADVMAAHVVTALETTTLAELAETIVEHGVKRIPILRNGRVVGIVSRADLVAAIARTPALLM